MDDRVRKAFNSEFINFEFESEFERDAVEKALEITFGILLTNIPDPNKEEIDELVKNFKNEYISLRAENNIKMGNAFEAMDTLADFFMSSSDKNTLDESTYEEVIEGLKRGDGSVEGDFSLKPDDITKAIRDLELNLESVSLMDMYTHKLTREDVLVFEEIWSSDKNQSSIVQSYALSSYIFDKKPDNVKKAILDKLFDEGLYTVLIKYIEYMSVNIQIELSDKYRETLAVKEDYENAALFRDLINKFSAKL